MSWLPQMIWDDIAHFRADGIVTLLFLVVALGGVIGGVIRLLWRSAPREKRRLWRGVLRRTVRKAAHHPLGLVQNFCTNLFRGRVL